MIHCGPYWTPILVAKLSAQMKLPSKTAYSRAVSSNLPPLAGAPAQRVGVGSPDAPNIPASINTQTKQPDKSSEYRERWNALKPQLTVIHGHPRTPDEQMAIDETWAREVAAGTRQPTIRLWEWAARLWSSAVSNRPRTR